MLCLLFGRNTVSRMLRPVTVAGAICAAVLTNQMAFAADTPLQTVNQLLDQGKVNEAAKMVQSHLKQNPSDVQMRFLQGVIAAEQQKYDQAIEVFTQLTQDYPTLPEPYNNLAVLHAAKGQERKAAQVLEQAIRTNPSYATAHENLGDLYARMASDAYAKALQLDSTRQAIQPKLALIKQIFPAQAQSVATASAAPIATAAAPAPKPEPVTQPAAPVPAAVVAAVQAAAEATPTAAPAVAAPVPAPEKVQASAPAEARKKPAQEDRSKQAAAAVRSAVAAWARAWEQQDMSAYYAAYSSKFEPQGMNLAQWKAERKERIVGKDSITVDVQDLKVNVQGERALANFRQYYAAGSFKASTRKTLTMLLEGEKWRIVREETGR